MMQANINVLHALSSIRCPFLDTLMLIVTELGNEILVIAAVCVLYWCVSKNAAYRLGMAFFASGMLVQGLKTTLHIARPWVLDPTLKPVKGALPKATGYSFPSGHTQGATALYGFAFAEYKRPWARILSCLLIAAVAFSRMYLGVHTPLDVVTAIVLTALCIYALEKLSPLLTAGEKHDLAIATTLAALSVGLCIYTLVFFRLGLSDAQQLRDCLKAGGAGLGFAIGFFVERRYIRFDTRTNAKWQQAVKLSVGVAVALLLKSGLKALCSSPLMDFVRYLFTVLWVTVAYPLLFSRVLHRRSTR